MSPASTARARRTRVVLAAAHLDNDPANNRLTYRRRRAIGDLFRGPYDRQTRPLALFATTARTPAFRGRPA